MRVDRVGAADHRLGRAVPGREAEALLGEVDADDPLRALQAAADHGAEPDHAGAEDDARRSRLDLGRVHRRADPGQSPQAKSAAPSSGASGLIFASAISGMTVYSANVEVPMKWRIGSPPAERRVVPSGR